MQLHKESEIFKTLIQLTAESIGLNPQIIEKDYWITYALFQLAQAHEQSVVVFKGGTSLTKCYTDLHRFSEDIDLALLADGMTKSKVKATLAKVERIMSQEFEAEAFMEERKTGYYRYTQFKYPTLFQLDLLELHSAIRLEISSFMDPHPFEVRPMRTYIANYLETNNFSEAITEFGLEAFSLQVLSLERTVLEKMIALVRMSYEVKYLELHTKTRHFYDIHLVYPLIIEFMNDESQFIHLANMVKQAETQTQFYLTYPSEIPWNQAPLFRIITNESLENSYSQRFGEEFVYGELPAFSDICETFKKIHMLLIQYNL